MRALMIDDGVKAQIAQALKEAPTIPYEVLKRYGKPTSEGPAALSLAERTQIDEHWQRPPSAEVLVPQGYRLCISREQYPAAARAASFGLGRGRRSRRGAEHGRG